MTAPDRYCVVQYKRSSMQRQIVAISHSVKALRRKHKGHIFRVEVKAAPASRYGLKEYTIVGKAIPQEAAAVATNTDARPLRSHSSYRRYRRKNKQEIAI